MKEKPLHQRLRGIASDSLAGLLPEYREAIREAAAEIEGHNEAFAAVVEQKHDALSELVNCRTNLQHRHEFIANWRDLLVALQNEHPTDIRIRRALMGEKPLVPAAWEKK